LRSEGHSAAGWSKGGSVLLQTAGQKSVLSSYGRRLIALRCLMLMLVSRPLRIVNCCCSGFPVIDDLKKLQLKVVVGNVQLLEATLFIGVVAKMPGP